MPVSKPFAIATEGQTIDGRNISREQIQQMATNYDPKVYTAVTNLEHLLSYQPDSVFSAYGHVVKLGTQEVEIMGEKKLQLTAIVDASDAIVAMQKVGKKAFASIEIAANFLNKGIAYLSGLAFTDTPASIGTESMKFSAVQQHIYSFKDEISIEFEPESSAQSIGETLFSKVKELLGLNKKDHDARFSDIGQAVEAIAKSQKDLLEKFSDAAEKELRDEVAAFRQKISEIESAHKKTSDEFAAFKSDVEKMSGKTPSRPAATGNKSNVVTDC